MVEYTGQSQPIGEIRQELIRKWLKTLGKDKSTVELFEREYLFREDGIDHWIPVQAKVAAYFDDELTVGQPVELFVVWVGAHYAGAEITWVFIANEFSTP